MNPRRICDFLSDFGFQRTKAWFEHRFRTSLVAYDTCRYLADGLRRDLSRNIPYRLTGSLLGYATISLGNIDFRVGAHSFSYKDVYYTCNFPQGSELKSCTLRHQGDLHLLLVKTILANIRTGHIPSKEKNHGRAPQSA